MNILVCGFGLMGKKVTQAVRNNEKMNLIGVVSPIFDETIKENMYSSFHFYYMPFLVLHRSFVIVKNKNHLPQFHYP